MLDFDQLASALTLGGDVKAKPTAPLIQAGQGAWQGAYNKLVRMNAPVDVWLIKSIPASHAHPRLLEEWLALDYDIHVVDPGAAWCSTGWRRSSATRALGRRRGNGIRCISRSSSWT